MPAPPLRASCVVRRVQRPGNAHHGSDRPEKPRRCRSGLCAAGCFTIRLQRILEQANVPWSAPHTLVNLTALASVLLAALLLFRTPLLPAVGAAAAVFVLPIVCLFRRRKKRIKKLISQLPDVFELLGQALRAGHSLASGMKLIADELPDPAGTEFGRVFHEQNLGLKV